MLTTHPSSPAGSRDLASRLVRALVLSTLAVVAMGCPARHAHPDNWKVYIKNWMHSHGMEGNVVVLTEGPSSKHPEANNRMEIVDLR